MRGNKILAICTFFGVLLAGGTMAQTSFGLSFSYNQGRYPYGGYPMGGGCATGGCGNMSSLYSCMSSPYMMSAANAGAYGPGMYGPGPGGPGFGPPQMPMPPPLPALPPPVPYMPAPQMAPVHPGMMAPCGGTCMPTPPPCGMGCGGAGMGGYSIPPQYAGNGIFFGASGQAIIDDRGIMEWEKNDTAAIVAATGGTLNGLASTVYPYAPYRYDPTPTPYWYQSGPRLYDLNSRDPAH